MKPTDDLRIKGYLKLMEPSVLKAELPIDIVHAIASHSSNYSKIPPKRVEAAILYHADHVLTETWKISRNIDVSFDLRD